MQRSCKIICRRDCGALSMGHMHCVVRKWPWGSVQGRKHARRFTALSEKRMAATFGLALESGASDCVAGWARCSCLYCGSVC